MTRIGELFAGYGGLGMAVQQVYGGEVVWYSEFEPAPSAIMAHHHPGVPNYGDVTAIDWATVPPVDILTGGFPCQDVSVAGRRAGMTDGTRSGLWSHMAHAVDVLRPSLVVIENVGGLFSAEATRVVESHPLCLGDGGTGVDTVLLRAVDAVLSTLSELGYDAEWTALRAADVGAPHGRLRVFITAHPAEDASGSRGGRWATLPLAGVSGGADAPTLRADPRPDAPGPALRLMPTPRALDATGVRGVTVNRSDEANARAGLTLTDVTRLLPTPVSQPSGNSPEEHLRKKPGRDVVTDLSIIAEHGLFETGGRLIPTPSVADATGGHERRGGVRGDELLLKGLAKEGHLERFGPYAPVIARWEHALGRPAPDPTEPGKTRPRLSSRFVEWLMGLDDGHVTDVGLTRNQELKALGNGVVPQQGAAALHHLHHIRMTYLLEGDPQ